MLRGRVGKGCVLIEGVAKSYEELSVSHFKASLLMYKCTSHDILSCC